MRTMEAMRSECFLAVSLFRKVVPVLCCHLCGSEVNVRESLSDEDYPSEADSEGFYSGYITIFN